MCIYFIYTREYKKGEQAMSVYNITGWSGGGRRPLTYNLRAGQFRNMGGCNVFGMPTRTVINNNFGGCGYNYDCGCNSGSRVPSWMQWCMGGGMVMNFLGNMMSALFPGKESTGTDGKGATLTEDQNKTLSMLKALVKDEKYTIIPGGNGTFLLKKPGDKGQVFNSLDELNQHIIDNFTVDPDYATDDAETTKPVITEEMQTLAKTLGITIENDNNGKLVYKVGNNSYENLDEAIKNAVPAASQSAPAAAPAAATYDLTKLKVHDEKRGQQYDISGTVNAVWSQTNGTEDKTKPPTSITVNNRSRKYEYNATGKTVEYNGVQYPTYTLASINGNTNVNTQTYILINGKLVQPANLKLEGSGSGSKITKT